MAKRLVTELIDDLDGRLLGDGGSTVQFGLDGKQYEIDLSRDNAEHLRNTLASYVQAARPAGKAAATGRRGRAVTGSARSDLSAIREWARGRGYQVSDRGRVPLHVIEAYDAAH